MSGDIFVCHSGEWDIYVLLTPGGVKARDAVKHPITLRTATVTRGHSAQHVRSAEVGNLSSAHGISLISFYLHQVPASLPPLTSWPLAKVNY